MGNICCTDQAEEDSIHREKRNTKRPEKKKPAVVIPNSSKKRKVGDKKTIKVAASSTLSALGEVVTEELPREDPPQARTEAPEAPSEPPVSSHAVMNPLIADVTNLRVQQSDSEDPAKSTNEDSSFSDEDLRKSSNASSFVSSASVSRKLNVDKARARKRLRQWLAEVITVPEPTAELIRLDDPLPQAYFDALGELEAMVEGVDYAAEVTLS